MEDQLQSLTTSISSLKREISLQKHRQSLLKTTLLSSPRTKTHLSRAPPTPKRKSALSACDDASLATLSISRRATAGVSAFSVRDPDPHAVDGGRVLGLRFDVFSRAKRRFVKPFYVFVVRVLPSEDGQTGEDVWRVHKHTVPPAVPLGSLSRRFLPQPEGEGGDDSGIDVSVMPSEVKQDLGAFVRGVRRELVGMVRRKEKLERLDGLVKGAGFERFDIVDGVGREVEIEIEDLVVRIGIDESGEVVEKVIVRELGIEGLSGRRRELERVLMNDGGWIDGIVDRLKEALS